MTGSSPTKAKSHLLNTQSHPTSQASPLHKVGKEKTIGDTASSVFCSMYSSVLGDSGEVDLEKKWCSEDT